MKLEIRKNRLVPRKPRGTAGKGSICYSLPLPTTWLREMGVTPEKREVILVFNGTEISIKKAEQEMNVSASEEENPAAKN